MPKRKYFTKVQKKRHQGSKPRSTDELYVAMQQGIQPTVLNQVKNSQKLSTPLLATQSESMSGSHVYTEWFH